MNKESKDRCPNCGDYCASHNLVYSPEYQMAVCHNLVYSPEYQMAVCQECADEVAAEYAQGGRVRGRTDRRTERR